MEELSRRADEAMDRMEEQITELAAKPYGGRSPDNRVLVRVTGAGEVLAVRLRAGALHHYTSAALSQVVTRTIREAQQKARAAFEEEAQMLTPPEVGEVNRLMKHAIDHAKSTLDMPPGY